MILGKDIDFKPKPLIINPNENYPTQISGKKPTDIQFLTFKNEFIKKEEQEKINSLSNLYSMIINPPILINPFLSLDVTDKDKKKINYEIKQELFEIPEKKLIFKVNYPEKISLFTNSERNFILNEEEIEIKKENKNTSKLEQKRKRRPRKENKDNIRRKIKRGFLNSGVIQKLNQKLKDIGSNLYFMRFPQSFVSDIFRKSNREVVNMTLREIFENRNINVDVNKNPADLNNYYHNLKVVKSIDIIENKELQKILNKKYCDLFEEYLNSKEFNIEEINRLKRKSANNDFILRYIDISKHFIEFFSQ